ncbi:putative phage abortive infection protein [Pseudomonas mandelii]|uniref:Phage abortive infection protein n=1 Tax=Pseudomonas mandelii TaxID=75612 RepID=A0ABY0VVW9_9PSED|nr:putative phage abortive infection protein [Pseudomonas mandelii]TWS07955.1 hypothetical protein FJD35_23900 [Pseudomonas mandelii]SDU58502.1 Putative phage abortive infection protein [Pseudomonas mandelii]
MWARDSVFKKFWEYVKRNLFFVGVALFAITVCSIVFGVLYLHFFRGVNIPKIAVVNHDTASYWGQLGDFAGGFLNPLLSFLALMAVLKTMALQRTEMRAAQQEAKTATQEQRQQTAVYSRQMFESTLFGMLDVHAKILRDIKYTGPLSKPREGREAIDMIVKSFKETNAYKGGIAYPDLVTDESIQSEIDAFCQEWVSATGHYFRNLYWIMKMIDTNQDVPMEDRGVESLLSNQKRFYTDYLRKRRYTNIVRAQLSESEMALIQISCLGPYGADLKYYAEIYSLLKPLGRGYFGGWKRYMSRSFSDVAFLGLERIDMGTLMKVKSELVSRNASTIRRNMVT